MATYCIGDVHGCADELQELLKLIKFNKENDELIFTGDIIGRGPKTLEVVQFVRELGNKAHMVLGNHEINFLAIAHGAQKAKKRDLLDKIISSQKFNEIVAWFSEQPLLYKHPTKPIYVVHAGIMPEWDLTQAYNLSQEMHKIFTDTLTFKTFLAHMYSDQPDKWSEELTGIPRWRFLVNAFTRLRFCRADNSIDLENKSSPSEAVKQNLFSWFEKRTKPLDNNNSILIFGHWAALMGQCNLPNIKALDTGCIWGGRLTAWCYETNTFYSVPSKQNLLN